MGLDIRRNYGNCKHSDEIGTDSGGPAVASSIWRVTIDNPLIGVMGPEMSGRTGGHQRLDEADVAGGCGLDSAVVTLTYFLNHSDFTAKIGGPDLDAKRSHRLAALSQTLLPDLLCRSPPIFPHPRLPANGDGSEITLACDMSCASREKVLSPTGSGCGDGRRHGAIPWPSSPQLIGRNRALSMVAVELEDNRAEQADVYYINRALPDAGTRCS